MQEGSFFLARAQVLPILLTVRGNAPFAEAPSVEVASIHYCLDDCVQWNHVYD